MLEAAFVLAVVAVRDPRPGLRHATGQLVGGCRLQLPGGPSLLLGQCSQGAVAWAGLAGSSVQA